MYNFLDHIKDRVENLSLKGQTKEEALSNLSRACINRIKEIYSYRKDVLAKSKNSGLNQNDYYQQSGLKEYIDEYFNKDGYQITEIEHFIDYEGDESKVSKKNIEDGYIKNIDDEDVNLGFTHIDDYDNKIRELRDIVDKESIQTRRARDSKLVGLKNSYIILTLLLYIYIIIDEFFVQHDKLKTTNTVFQNRNSHLLKEAEGDDENIVQDVDNNVDVDEEITFENNPLTYLLIKYESLKEILESLMGEDFKSYLSGIYITAPKPTTFKVVLHNNRDFYLIYSDRGYQAEICGKFHYLNNLGQLEHATKSISDLLRQGVKKLKVELPDKEKSSTSSKPKKPSGGSKGGLSSILNGLGGGPSSPESSPGESEEGKPNAEKTGAPVGSGNPKNVTDKTESLPLAESIDIFYLLKKRYEEDHEPHVLAKMIKLNEKFRKRFKKNLLTS